MQAFLSVCSGLVISTCMLSIAWAQQYYNVDLNVLGYSPTAQQVYVQESPIHSHAIARVYAYDLKKSRYDLAKYESTTAKAENATEFEQHVQALKQDLQALQPVDLNSLNIDILQQDQIPREHNETVFPFSYSTQFVISNKEFATQPQNLYHLSTDIQLTHAYLLPQNKGILATFKSIIYADGSGLYREESVILLP